MHGFLQHVCIHFKINVSRAEQMDRVGTRRKSLVLAAIRMKNKREQTKAGHIVAKNLLTMSPGIYIF